MGSKVFVIDTNVLLTDPNSIFSFEENDIIIPFQVLEELDKKKNEQNSTGKSARTTIRHLDELRKKGSLKEGVQIADHLGKLYVKTEENGHSPDLPDSLKEDSSDNKIIATFKRIEKKDVFSGQKIKMVTNDINLRVKCNSLNIPCEEYSNIQMVNKPDSIYQGRKTVELPYEKINRFYGTKEDVYLEESEVDDAIYPNEFLKIVPESENKSGAFVRFKGFQEPLKPVSFDRDRRMWKSTPRNMGQCYAADLLFDSSVPIVSLTGQAGVGKTLCAIEAGLHQTLNDNPAIPERRGMCGNYDRFVIMRPIEPVGRDIGYLPGDVSEKMDPWLGPIRDNLRNISGTDNLDMFLKSGEIELQALTYVRGRSISNAYIFIDSAQNLTPEEIKTVLTRVGDNSKVVLAGDVNQIDNAYIDEVSNGLTYAVEKLKHYDITGHVTLTEGERSEVASLAADVL